MAAGSNGVDNDTTRHRRWLVDMSSVIPEFDPLNGSLMVNQWINKVEEYAVMYQ